MSKYPFVGRFDDEAKEILDGIIQAKKEMGRELLPGELEKTPEEVELLTDISSWLKGELRDLGLDDELDFNIDNFHFFDQKGFNNLPEEHTILSPAASSEATSSLTVVNRDFFKNESKLVFIDMLTHEATHMASYLKHGLVPVSGQKLPFALKVYRTGLAVSNLKGKHYFEGLNEAVTTFITLKVLGNHAQELVDKYGVSKEEWEADYTVYPSYLNLFSYIAQKTAEQKGQTFKEGLVEFEKGYFTGNMMFLKSVERTFGPGSLRVLGTVGRQNYKEWVESGNGDKVLEFFEANDRARKDELAKQLLDQDDLERYMKRQRDDEE